MSRSEQDPVAHAPVGAATSTRPDSPGAGFQVPTRSQPPLFLFIYGLAILAGGLFAIGLSQAFVVALPSAVIL